jgi:hypothetical protein
MRKIPGFLALSLSIVFLLVSCEQKNTPVDVLAQKTEQSPAEPTKAPEKESAIVKGENGPQTPEVKTPKF